MINLTASVVDLFCGAGGLTYGFILEGMGVNAGIDVDPACRYPYEYNNSATFLERDISSLPADDVISLFPPGDLRILAGCAPCQQFSTYTQARKPQSEPKWSLLRKFGDIIEATAAPVVTMENVALLRRHQVYEDFIGRLRTMGYHVAEQEVNCADYGVPQSRRRLVVLASTYGEIDLVAATHDETTYETVRSTIVDLPAIAAGVPCPGDPLHRASSLSETNLRRIRSSRPGGTWRDWDAELRASCHSRASGNTYPSVYGRMEWDKPSPTVTTQCHGYGNGRFGHPDQDRAISLREAALLQTFPPDYVFFAEEREITYSTAGRLIGNAVPVKLARAIARSIRHHLEDHHGR